MWLGLETGLWLFLVMAVLCLVEVALIVSLYVRWRRWWFIAIVVAIALVIPAFVSPSPDMRLWVVSAVPISFILALILTFIVWVAVEVEKPIACKPVGFVGRLVRGFAICLRRITKSVPSERDVWPLAWLVAGLVITGLTFCTLAWGGNYGELCAVSLAFAVALLLMWLLMYSWLSDIGARDSDDPDVDQPTWKSLKRKFTTYEKGLIEEFRYQTDRLNRLNTWRDAFILAFLVGYGSLLGVALKNTQLVRDFLENTSTMQDASGPLALMCGIAGIVGLFVLRRLAADRGHAVRAVNECTDLINKLRHTIGWKLPEITGRKRVQPAVSVGSQWTSDMIVILLNAIPFTAAIMLSHIKGGPVTGCEGLCAMQWFTEYPETVLWIWLAMVFAQLLAYTIWVKGTPGSFKEGNTQRGQ